MDAKVDFSVNLTNANLTGANRGRISRRQRWSAPIRPELISPAQSWINRDGRMRNSRGPY